MELTITSMTPADRLYAYNQSSHLKGKPAVSAICAGILALEKSFTLPGSTIGGNTRRTSLRRSLMRWSTLCGRRMGCSVPVTA